MGVGTSAGGHGTSSSTLTSPIQVPVPIGAATSGMLSASSRSDRDASLISWSVKAVSESASLAITCDRDGVASGPGLGQKKRAKKTGKLYVLGSSFTQ